MQYCRPGKLEIPAGRALYGRFNGLTLQRIAVMVETKSNALPLERGKALPTQNRGITAEWQGNKQRTRGCGRLFMCGKRKSETNGGGRRTYISPKRRPTHQVKHGTEKHNDHSEMAEPQTETQKGSGNAAK